MENVDKEFWKCKGESSRWGYITDQHRNAPTLSAIERWKKRRFKRAIKELSQFDNSQRSLSQSFTILIRIISIQLRLSKAVTLWI